MRTFPKVVVVILLVLALVGSTGAVLISLLAPADGATDDRPARTVKPVVPPPTGERWDYQLGGAATPPDGVGVVSRDRLERPVPGRYNVCYVNAFQTQDSEAGFWRNTKARWALVLKDKRGKAVVDSGWGEWLLDMRTTAKRQAIAAIVDRWIDRCAADGFDAVEPDNLDSFSRSKGLVSKADNKAFAALIIARAHSHGLAIAQKNWPELGAKGPALGFDFAVAEQCGQFRECGDYVDAYGAEVLAVEYQDAAFAWTCSHFGDRLSVVRRDRNLTTEGVRGYC